MSPRLALELQSVRKKLGLIVNPIAGIGGRVGLKGSDGIDIQKKALLLGAKSESSQKTIEALRMIKNIEEIVQVITYPGEMGENSCKMANLPAEIIGSIESGATTSGDTIQATRDLFDKGVDLILFAGGDGTARNIYEGIDSHLPVLGIPAGVKIHSAVYAATPKKAGELASLFLSGKITQTVLAEVMDIDEEAFRQGIVSASLYGYLQIPNDKRFVQGAKARSSQSDKDALYGIGQEIIGMMTESPELPFIFGPGTTTGSILELLDLEYSLLGVDVVKNNSMLIKDANESLLLELLENSEAKIIVTVIGGQGHILGRGNQQLSPRVLRKVGKKNIVVIATESKLASLHGRPLLVDAGDQILNDELVGFIKVITGFGKITICKVE